jgi:HK97 family phage major capsid protein
MTSTELRQQRARIIEQMREAAKQAEEARAKGESATDFDLKFDRAVADETVLQRKIEALERIEAEEKRAAANHLEDLDRRGTPAGGGDNGKKHEYRDAFSQFFKFGYNALDADQRSILQTGFKSMGEARAQSTTNTAGGYLIAPEYMPELDRALKDYSAVLQVARIVPTSTGANMPWPTIDATARKAAIVAENATSTPTDFTFGQKSLDAYMYRDMAAASLELVQDSAFDIGAFIQESFGESFGRGYNYDFTLGTGSSQPNGLVTASTLGKTAASATTFTRSEIVDLIHSVDPGYRRSMKCGFMFNDAVLAAIKKLAIGASDATPLWQVSMREGEPDKLEGFPYWVNSDMSSAFTTGQKLILFGDYNKYVVRQVLGMTMRRLEERFIDSGQIGFIAFGRADGELINTAAVKHLKLA